MPPPWALVVLVAILAVGCTQQPSPSGGPRLSLGPEVDIECGPVSDRERCQAAVEVAATAKTNPPPIVAASIRLPRADDQCLTWMHPCVRGSVIVAIQSGDTLQEVPLVPAGDGWMRLDLVR